MSFRECQENRIRVNSRASLSARAVNIRRMSRCETFILGGNDPGGWAGGGTWLGKTVRIIIPMRSDVSKGGGYAFAVKKKRVRSSNVDEPHGGTDEGSILQMFDVCFCVLQIIKTVFARR